MTELEHAIKHIKTRADAWAVKEVTEALQSISERLDKALSQEPCRVKNELNVELNPCTDAVSREAVLNAICDYVAFEEYEDKSHTFTVKPLEKRIDALPSVTPSRHVNCEIAEHDGNGCLGYSHYGDDFPVEECLHCSKYTSYEEE